MKTTSGKGQILENAFPSSKLEVASKPPITPRFDILQRRNGINGIRTQFIELGGGDLQYERPDVWIRPDESVVVAVKAAQVTATDSFRTGYTLRFPRFKKLRTDRTWDSALTLSGFSALKSNVEKEQREKKFKIDDSRKKQGARPRKKALTVAGTDVVVSTPYGGPASDVFAGLNFCRFRMLQLQ